SGNISSGNPCRGNFRGSNHSSGNSSSGNLSSGNPCSGTLRGSNHSGGNSAVVLHA
ncbi:hypothetical protein NDU88_002660, partial [Pleurodeles waltl]